MYDDINVISLRDNLSKIILKNFELYKYIKKDQIAINFSKYIMLNGIEKIVDLYFEKFSDKEIEDIIKHFIISLEFSESDLGKKVINFTVKDMIPMEAELMEKFMKLERNNDYWEV